MNFAVDVSTSAFLSRDGRVTVKGTTVNYVTEVYYEGVRAIVCRALAGPGKSVEFILSKQNF